MGGLKAGNSGYLYLGDVFVNVQTLVLCLGLLKILQIVSWPLIKVSYVHLYCRIGWRWIVIILGLALYGLLLLPGFVQGEFLSGLVSKYAPLFHNMWSCMTHTHIPWFNVCRNYAIRCQSIM